MVWSEFTRQAFNFSWHIITTPTEEVTWESDTKVMCEECKEVFSDDEYDEDELVHGKFLCESCRDDIIRDHLEK